MIASFDNALHEHRLGINIHQLRLRTVIHDASNDLLLAMFLSNWTRSTSKLRSRRKLTVLMLLRMLSPVGRRS
jgi:hypothetical protein